MGNRDYLSGGCDLPGKLLYYMIMPENLNKNLEQKSYTECVYHEN